MRWISAPSLFVAMMSLAVGCAAPVANRADRLAARRTPVVRIYEKCKDAVVVVRGVAEPDLPASSASGFIVHESGFVVTCKHVAYPAKALEVIVSDGTVYPAELVALDEPYDLALLKIEPSKPLKALRLGRSKDLMIGETALTIAHAYNKGAMCTTGTITALPKEPARRGDPTRRAVIQSNVGVYPGSSGAALLNVHGEVIGVNYSRIRNTPGIGSSVPVDRLHEVLPKWIAVERRYGILVGLRVAALGPCVVTNAWPPGSPATKAGLAFGDVVTALGKKTIRHGLDYHFALIGRKPHERLKISYRRGTTTRTKALILVAGPKLPPHRLRHGIPSAKQPALRGSEPLMADRTVQAVNGVPAKYRPDLIKRLGMAKGNLGQLVDALLSAPPAHRGGLAFLITHMPERDLTSLSKEFLLENVALAYRSREQLPWGSRLPEEVFLNYVLPYASVNEHRDRWRKDFHEKFLPIARQCNTPGEAAVRLNRDAFKMLGVKYHRTKRKKPDQGPAESMELGFASCSGLSILLIDACRAVCVPARFTGTPMWTNRRGNHSWVEIWDGQWRFLGAAESTALDRAGFAANAAKADPTREAHRIYAATWQPTDRHFPLIWDLSIEYVPAVDVTAFYTRRRNVRVEVVGKDGKPPAGARLTLRLSGRVVAAAAADKPVELRLAGGQTYDAEVQLPDNSPPIHRTVRASTDKDPVVRITLP